MQIATTGSEATYHALRLSRAYTGRDHIVVMQGGRVVAQGTPEQVLAVDNEDVQRFIRASGVEAGRLKQRPSRKPARELAAIRGDTEGIARDLSRSAVAHPGAFY